MMGASTKPPSILRALFAMMLLSGSVMLVGGVTLENDPTFTACLTAQATSPCTQLCVAKPPLGSVCEPVTRCPN
jgi:hypothetical protein